MEVFISLECLGYGKMYKGYKLGHPVQIMIFVRVSPLDKPDKLFVYFL